MAFFPQWPGSRPGQMPTQEGIDRRKQMADALMRASQQPTGLSGPWGGIVAALTGAAAGWQQRRAGMDQKEVDDDWNAKFTEALMQSGADPSAIKSAGMLPMDQKRALLGQIAATKLAPKKAPELIKVSPGDRLYDPTSNKEVFSVPEATDKSSPIPIIGPDGKPTLVARNDAIGKTPYNAPAASTNVNVNTEKGLYGTLAEKQAGQYSDLYSRAQSAPERIDRAARVRGLLQDGAITGAGANQKLAIARGLKALGLYDNEDIANTELLGRELAGSALEAIKSSGLGAGSGFSNADRDFLEKVAGGQITQDAQTLQRIAELNDRAARAEIAGWNDVAGSLQPDQLKTLGMRRIELPASLPQTSGKPNDVNQVLQQLQADPKYRQFFQQQ